MGISMSKLFVIFWHREPLYYLGFFTEGVAEQLIKEFEAEPKSSYSVRQIQPNATMPGLHRYEAAVLLASGDVLFCERMPAEPSRTVSWISPQHQAAFGRGFTEEEAIQVAKQARSQYQNKTKYGDDEG
jgi:hypothetical protein